MQVDMIYVIRNKYDLGNYKLISLLHEMPRCNSDHIRR